MRLEGWEGQARRLTDLVRHRFRISRDVGQLHAVASVPTFRVHYPDNPEIPERIWEYPLLIPGYVNSRLLPDTQEFDSAQLTHRRWLATTAEELMTQSGASASLPHDIHSFHTTSGTAERGQQAFSLVSSGPNGFTLDYGDRVVETRLINQDHAGLWRTELAITTATGTVIGNGILVEVDGPQAAWSAAMVPGSYRVRSPGGDCDGPYADIAEAYEYGECSSPSVGWRKVDLRPDQTGNWTWSWHENPAYANANPVQWSITVGAVPGRLEIAHLANGGIWNSRGLEIIKRVGDRYWLLQNFSDTPSPLPPVYTPATSFLAWDRL